MSKVRPPFVLVFVGDLAGCGFHRGSLPLLSLVMPGHAEGRMDAQFWPLDMILAAKPDTIVFQRFLEEAQVEAMEAIRQHLPDALMVYELDDYLGEIPAASFHAGFMPPDLPAKIARAASVCDRVTTSTEPLADWFRNELGQKDVRVVANAIPGAAIQKRAARKDGRMRVGFAGGISHTGDLEIIRPAMQAIGEEVEWVFFGMQPKHPPVRVEFHQGVQPHEYQAKMAKLDLDLILAPLEDNRFNICKSNLRILEGGMIGAAVIAQRLEPYLDGNPPVYAFADTPGEWTEAIQSFMTEPAMNRQVAADKMADWVIANHTLEGRTPARIDAWLRKTLEEPLWIPNRPVAKRDDDTVLALADGQPPRILRYVPRKTGLIEACERAAAVGADVLWLRPGSAIDKDGWHALRSTLAQTDGISCAIPLACDGPNAFPRADHWTPMANDLTLLVSEALRAEMPGRKLIAAAPSGPCILLAARALAAIGFPDVDGCDGNEEQALMEWGLRAAMRGWKTMQAADVYVASPVPPIPPVQRAVQRLQLRGYGQVFGHLPAETLTGQERLTIELDLLRLSWAGPMPGTAGFGHDYASWSALRGGLAAPAHEHAASAKVSVISFESTPPDGDGWVIFVDDSISWHPHGLATLRAAAHVAPDKVLVVYADNEYRSPEGGVFPDFKPDFDLELFLARDYVSHVCAIRVSAIADAKETPHSRPELYAFLLELAERHGASVFHHIPKMVAEVCEQGPEDAAIATLTRQMAIEDCYGPAVSVQAHPYLPGALAARRNHPFQPGEAPLVSIIVPTLGAGKLIQPCVNTLLQHTAYPNFEILVVQNGDQREQPELGKAVHDRRVRVVHWAAADGKFNWSALSNDVVRDHAQGDYICFVNDDVCAIAEEWLDVMMGQACREDVGAVGAKLVHPAGFIQHAGVIAHHGVAAHMCKGLQNGQPSNGWLTLLSHQASAVTGACMLVSRKKFDQVGGFDAEHFPMNYGDTDFCLKLQASGLRNVVEIGAELLHPEGTSRTDPNDQATLARTLQADNARFAARWPGADPYWHPSLALGVSQGGLSITGLNRDMLLWDEKRPALDAKRTLLINDLPGLQGQAVDRQRCGETVFFADLSGFALRLTAPTPANTGGWDVRDVDALADGLKRLGIDKVVLRSLVGQQGAAAPVEALRALARIGTRAEIDPIAPALVTPWLAEGDPIPVFASADMTSWRAAHDALVPQEEAAA